MKPVLVDACNHFDFAKSTCSKCGRSLPDVCLEFEQMKQKAEAYERLQGQPTAIPVRDERNPDISLDSAAATVAEVKKSRGRPRKVTNEKNATD